MSQWTYIIGRIVVSPLGYSHEQTTKEYEKFICKLKQKIDVERIYVEITGQGKKIHWKKG